MPANKFESRNFHMIIHMKFNIPNDGEKERINTDNVNGIKSLKTEYIFMEMFELVHV